MTATNYGLSAIGYSTASRRSRDAVEWYYEKSAKWPFYNTRAATTMLAVTQDFGQENVNGKKVICRFHWIRTDSGSPRWEQSFSADVGKTWETNRIMTFTRDDQR